MGAECNSATFRDLPLKRCRRFIEVLPDDILVQILCCLPCQSAVTCKLVCKRWLSLISTPSFISCFISHRRQIKNAQQQDDDDDDDDDDEKYRILKADGYIFLTTTNSRLLNPDISFTFLPSSTLILSSSVFNHEIRILASSDDLFLCSRTPSIIALYYICNPFTKEWLELPQPPPSTSFNRDVFGFTHNPYLLNVEDGSEQQHVVQVNSSCRFCVVRLKFPLFTTGKGASEFEVDIFSSHTWQWTTSMLHHSSCPSIPSSCISRNGLLYWLCEYPGQVIIHDPYNNAVRHVVELRPPATPSPRLFSFGVSQGSLLAFDKYCGVLRVWELEDEVCNGGHQQPKWRFVTRSLQLNFSTTFAVHPDDRNIIYFYNVRSGCIRTLSLRTGKLKHRFVQELVRTVNGRSYRVSSFKPVIVEMVVFNAPCWPTPVSALLNSRRLASST